MSEFIHVSVAWPYANGDLHIGHLAGNCLPADIFARYHRLKGNRVLMVSGSDSHGTPIMLTAEKEGLSTRETFEKYHQRFLDTQQQIGISYDLFTSTDTENHHRVAQDMFLKLLENEAIYQGTQQLLYDEVAERFVPDRFVEGTCYYCGYEEARGDQCDNCGHLIDALQLINPRSKFSASTPVVRDTEQYFLDLAQFKDRLHDYLADKDYWRANVINFARNMVDDLHERAITRDIDWGIDVPLEGWEDKRLYVWFEAVMGYLTASIEWAHNIGDPEAWHQWWYNPEAKIYNFLGKDNIPFHTVIWQSELLGVGQLYTDDESKVFNLPYDVPANEYLNMPHGEQFSKSRGTAVWLPDMLEWYDPDAIRYYVSAVMPETRDSEFGWDDFVARNNNELVGWWGNLVNRVLKFGYKNWGGKVPDPGELRPDDEALLATVREGFESVGGYLNEVKLRRGLEEAMRLAREVNVYLDSAPWFSVVKEDKQAAATTVYTALQAITYLKTLLAPWLPFTAQTLHTMLGFGGKVFGDLTIETYQEETRAHPALVYDGSKAVGKWEPETLPPGQALGEPVALFKKLDLDEVVSAE